MNKDPAIERFYTTTAWRKCRAAVLEENCGLCQVCMSKGLIEPAVHVHHKVPLTPDNIDDPRITLDSSNLMALCEECHAEMHMKRRWRVDESGHVIL